MLTNFKANKLFVDRVEPTELVNEAIERLQVQEDYKKIYVFYGMGGVGKTRFLSEISSRCAHLLTDELNTKIVKIGIEAYKHESVLGLIFAMRRKLDMEMVLFDYALVQYYNKSELSLQTLIQEFKNKCSSAVREIIEITTKTDSGIVPKISMLYSLKALHPSLNAIFSNRRLLTELNELEKMSAEEILSALPVIFAKLINQSEDKYIFIFDDFEKLENRDVVKDDKTNSIELINAIFQALTRTVFVIASREQTSINIYGNLDCEEKYLIGKLSRKDAEQYLKSIPIDDDTLIDDVIKVADGLPLFLDFCVEIYSDYKNGKIPSCQFERLDSNSITEQYLTHLSQNEIVAVKLIRYFNMVDRAFLTFIFREINLAIDGISLEKLLSRSIFELIENEYYKLDTTIKEHFHNDPLSPELKTEIILSTLKYVEELMSDKNYDKFKIYFESICQLLVKTNLNNNKNVKSSLIRNLHFSLDLGLWDFINHLLESYFITPDYKYLYDYFKCQILRRKGRLEQALELLHKSEIDQTWFDDYEYSVILLETQLRHLLGDYDFAIESYKNIVEEMKMLNLQADDVRTYFLSCLKYADQLFVHGEFKKALEYIDSVPINECDNLDMEIEYLRIKGHIFKFNLQGLRAKKVYGHALNKCKFNYKSRGELLNNMAEITAISAPEECLKYAIESLNLNGSIGAIIECGKTLCAKAIALSMLGDFKEADNAIDEALKAQTEARYQSGIAFCYFAKAFSLVKRNADKELISESVNQLTAILSATHAYKYLIDIANGFLAGQAPDTIGDYSWLDGTDINSNFERVFK